MAGRTERYSVLLLLVLLGWSLGAVGPLEYPATAQTAGKTEWPTTTLPAKNSAYILGLRPTWTIEAEYTDRIHHPELDINMWYLVVAKPPVLTGQRAVSASVTPAGREVIEAGPLKRRVLVCTVPGEGPARHTLEVKAHYRATLYARKLLLRDSADGSGGPPDLPPEIRAHYLRETKRLDYRSAVFSKWLDDTGLRRRQDEEEIAFARRAFRKVYEELEYELVYPETVSEVMQKGRCACGGFADVYISALRANGIPSRTLSGRWIPDTPGPGHATTEFFAPGVGWVPVDPTCGVFGEDRHDFFTLHVDGDLHVPVETSEPMNVAIPNPVTCFYTYEQPKDKLKPRTDDQSKWTIRAEKVDARRPPPDLDRLALVPRVGQHAERHNPYRPAAPSPTATPPARPVTDPAEDTEGLAYFWDRARGDYAGWSGTLRGAGTVMVRSKKSR